MGIGRTRLLNEQSGLPPIDMTRMPAGKIELHLRVNGLRSTIEDIAERPARWTVLVHLQDRRWRNAPLDAVPGIKQPGRSADCRARFGHMNDSQIAEIQNILSDVDTILRERREAIGLRIPHIRWRSRPMAPVSSFATLDLRALPTWLSCWPVSRLRRRHDGRKTTC